MTKKESYVHGQFCWVDLQTPDPAAAKEFYTKMFGWDSVDVPTDRGPAYTMFLQNSLSTAGMGPQPPEMKGAPPIWSSYVCVDDCAVAEAKAKKLGANVLMPTMQVMDQGWLAFVQDPCGAAVGCWQPNAHKGAGWVNSIGGFCWNELYVHDTEKARQFYSQLFGWEFADSVIPDREYWAIKNQGQANGGMMAIQEEWGPVPPNWSVYFNVASNSESLAKGESLGGKRFMDPIHIPGVGTFCGLQDPQGGHFLIIEMEEKG